MKHLVGYTAIARCAVTMLWLWGISCSCAAGTVVAVDPASPMVGVGDAVDVSIRVDGIADLYGVQFDVAFNAAVLAASSIDEGLFLQAGGATFFIPGVIDNSSGVISFTADALIGAIAGVDGSGVLAVVHLDAIGSGTSNVDVTNIVLLDSNNNDIAASAMGGVVNVAGGGAVPEPGSLLLAAVGLFAMGGSYGKRAKPPEPVWNFVCEAI